MKYISHRYLLSILSIFIIASSPAVHAQESAPSCVTVGKTYITVTGILQLTFTVEKIEGQWIKVKVIKGIPAKEITGDVWLNMRNLSILLEMKAPLGDDGKPKDSKGEAEE